MARTPPPHVPALDKEFEEPPKKRVDWNIAPPLSGIMYKVESGENFESYAIFAGMKVWDLIYYNFRTTDAKEVNWYLRTVVGCKKTTWDSKNFSFSDDADPGVIYFPDWAYKRLIASGRTPRKIVVWEDMEFNVHGTVPAVIQRGPTCWAAAFTMMDGWWYDGRRRVTEVLDEAGDGGWWTKQYNRGHGLSAGHTASLAKILELKGARKVPDTPEGWLRDLQEHGPLMVIQSSIEGWVHWIVVIGLRAEFPDIIELRYIDPFNGARHYRDLAALAREADGVDWSHARYFHY